MPATHNNFQTIRQQSSISSADNEETIIDKQADTNNNGMYLDEETYLQAEDNMLRSDGSLNLSTKPSLQYDQQEQQQYQQQQYTTRSNDATSYASATSATTPYVPKIKNTMYQTAVEGLFSPPPSYSYSDDTKNDDINLSNSQQQLSNEEKLYQAVMDIENGKGTQPVVDPETLHRQVFAEEQTYLQQSEEFRKSLSQVVSEGNDNENPMAKERREVVEQYNEKVLENMMKEISVMEELAVSREDAMMGVQGEMDKLLPNPAHAGAAASTGSGSNGRMKKDDAVMCSKCGLRVTPDMMQRAEMIAIMAKKDASGEQVPQKKKMMGSDVVIGYSNILCQACHGQKFRTNDEAKVRVGQGSPSYGDYNTMYDETKNPRQPWANKKGGGYNNKGKQKWKGSSDYGKEGGSKRSGVQGINTASLFDMPKKGTRRSDGQGIDTSSSFDMPTKGRSSDVQGINTSSSLDMPTNGYDAESKRESINAAPTPKTTRVSSNKRPSSSTPPSGGRQNQPPRRTSHILGGQELAKRMQRDSESSVSDDLEKQKITSLRSERTLKARKTERTRSSITQRIERMTPLSSPTRQEDSSKMDKLKTKNVLSSSTAKVSDSNNRNEEPMENNGSDNWVKVEDPGTKRIIFWNTETGEMKKTLD